MTKDKIPNIHLTPKEFKEILAHVGHDLTITFYENRAYIECVGCKSITLVRFIEAKSEIKE